MVDSLSRGRSSSKKAKTYPFASKCPDSCYSHSSGVGLRPRQRKSGRRPVEVWPEAKDWSMPKRHPEAPTQESRAQARKSLGTLKV